jgi:hypothetical protein
MSVMSRGRLCPLHRRPLDITVFIIVILLLKFYVLYQIVSLGDQLITLTPKQR